jgi:hypothetical protein
MPMALSKCRRFGVYDVEWRLRNVLLPPFWGDYVNELPSRHSIYETISPLIVIRCFALQDI